MYNCTSDDVSQGHECPFNHDFEPPRKMELCRYYVSGICSKQKTCVYYHDILRYNLLTCIVKVINLCL